VEEMLAITRAQGAILAVGGAIFLLLAAGSMFLRGRQKERRVDIPVTMRPGPSDEDLETPLLTRYQGWGVLLVVFFVIWIPLVWLQEPGQNLTQEKALLTDSIARGKLAVQMFSEENQGGVGCVRCHGPELRGQVISYLGKPALSADLTTVCERRTLIEIRTTIEQGRPGTPMPAWSIRYAGALDDQQIGDIIQYLVHINESTVPFDKNKCINPAAASPTPTASANASASPVGTATPTPTPSK
jgi:mono/diheme cytochrome c family protein